MESPVNTEAWIDLAALESKTGKQLQAYRGETEAGRRATGGRGRPMAVAGPRRRGVGAELELGRGREGRYPRESLGRGAGERRSCGGGVALALVGFGSGRALVIS